MTNNKVKDFLDKMEAKLEELQGDEGYFVLWNIVEEYKEIFKDELSTT